MDKRFKGAIVRRKGAFTLIELLIVVAIIAILAAIAVPNFLEAQVRAKVSRAKSDMRSIATAIESYSVDWNRVPLGSHEAGRWVPQFYGMPNDNQADLWNWAKLTTPIAYMTSVPHDPFALQGTIARRGALRNTFQYSSHYHYTSVVPLTGQGNAMPAQWKPATARGVHWLMASPGPSKRLFGDPNRGKSLVACSAGILGWPEVGNQIRYPNLIYDSSNGTVSFGYLIRTNKNQM